MGFAGPAGLPGAPCDRDAHSPISPTTCKARPAEPPKRGSGSRQLVGDELVDPGDGREVPSVEPVAHHGDGNTGVDVGVGG